MEIQQVSKVHGVQLPLSRELQSILASESYEWASCHGMVMYSKATQQLIPAPCTLIPTPFPKKCFQQAWDLARDFNIMNHELSKHNDFIVKVSESVSDPFTASLLSIFKTVHKEGIKQKATLGIVRSDYMLNVSSNSNPSLQQVELNTIAASFSNLGSFVSQMHRFVLPKIGISEYNVKQIPVNTTLDAIPLALYKAWQVYDNPDAVIVMIVHDGENNTFDQRWLEYLLWEKFQVRVLRRSLLDIHSRGSLSPNSELIIDGKVAAICYYRAGYSPDDYPSSKEWDARLLIERSLAIKTPSITWHLLGTKKMQQVLSEPEMLEKFLSDKDQCHRLRTCFTGLYSLSEQDANVDKIVAEALANPENFVLKPQREGGGNNLYTDDLKKTLSTASPLERSAYILMKRINPPATPTIFFREKQVIEAKSVCELGIYGAYLNDGTKEILNEASGYLLRTKISHVDDGGVAAGVAFLDSPYLVEDSSFT